MVVRVVAVLVRAVALLVRVVAVVVGVVALLVRLVAVLVRVVALPSASTRCVLAVRVVAFCVAGAGLRVSRVRFGWEAQYLVTPASL